ncbi:hypothetical protein EP7_004807 [Isosphaeraceae bacterium EP7]
MRRSTHHESHHMSCLFVAAISLAVGANPYRLQPAFFERGPDANAGVLINLTAGGGPADPFDPSRPTVVIAVGANPFSGRIHYTIAPTFAAAIGRRLGNSANVLEWAWGADSVGSVIPRRNLARAEDHGQRLAEALLATGVPPERLHLIGQSSGGTLMASAAQAIAGRTGRLVGQVTLLDPASCHHDVIFGQLCVANSAARVENYWAPGPSGYGGQAHVAGVWNYRVPGPGGLLATPSLTRSDHINTARFYLATIEDPANSAGFNTSHVLRGP